MLTMATSSENLIEDSSNGATTNRPECESQTQQRFHSTYKMRLELAAFLVYFGVNASSAVFQDQVLYQTCTVVFGYNRTVCDDLGTSKVKTDPLIKAVENIVQPFGAKIFMTESLVTAILPAFLALFIGAWTDKFGRKPIILVTITGYLGFLGIKAIIAGVSLWLHVNPWIYLTASIPLALSGGNCALLSAIYCYVADLTTLRERPFKMCLMGGIIALGNFVGQLISSYLYSATNASTVFAISTASQVVALIYVGVVIQESIIRDEQSFKTKVLGLFDTVLLKDMLNTVFKKREQFQTIIIWCVLIPLAAGSFDDAGTGDVFFLFLRSKFEWTIQNYTTFNAIRVVITFVGGTLGIISLQMILRVKLTTMTLIAYASFCVRAAFYASAEAPWYLYVGIALSCLSGIASPMGQSMLTNTVLPSDIGKVFTMVSALQAIAPLIASPLYTMVYNSTLEAYPGAYNNISVGLYLVCFILTGFVHLMETRHPNVNVAKTSVSSHYN